MNTTKILELIKSYTHLTALHNEAEEQLLTLKEAAPKAYNNLKNKDGSVTLEDAVGELCMIAEGYKMEIIEMLEPTAPDATVDEMECRWDDLWNIYAAVAEEAPYLTDTLEVVENCIAEQKNFIIDAGFEDKIDIGI